MSDITDEDLDSWLQTDIDPQLLQALTELKRRRAERVTGAEKVHRVVMEACSAFLVELGDRDQTTLQNLDEVNWYNLGVDIADYCATEFTTVPAPSAVAIPADLIEDVAAPSLSATDRDLLSYLLGWCTEAVGSVNVGRDRFGEAIAVLERLLGASK